MSWRIIVISKRAKLDLQLGKMVVRSDEITKIVLSEISTIIIESTAVSITALAYYLPHRVKRQIILNAQWTQEMQMRRISMYYANSDAPHRARIEGNCAGQLMYFLSISLK